MIPTTQTFYENSVFKYRYTKSQIDIDVFDLTAKSDIIQISVSNQRLAHIDELADDDREINTRYATGEKGQFKLDGSLTLMPEDYKGKEIGWWTELSNEQHGFNRTQKVIIQFNKQHSSAGITCYYDEYSLPNESICRWYRGEELLDEMILRYPSWTKQRFNNANIQAEAFNSWTVEEFNYGNAPAIQEFVNPVDGYDRVEIEMIKAQHAETCVKLYEIDFGLTYALTGEQLSGSKVKEQVSLISNTISANEISFSLMNYDGKYDRWNPSDLRKFFIEGQEIRARAGVKNRKTGIYEMISMGKYYLEPPSNKSSLLSVKGYGILNRLSKDGVYYSPFWKETMVYKIVADILLGYDFYVHPNVSDIKLTGYIPSQNKKDALKVVAIACGAIVKEGRDGKIYFYRATEELIANQLILEDTVYTKRGHAGMMLAGVMPLQSSLEAHPYTLRADKNTRLSDLDSEDIGFYYKFSIVYCNYAAEDENEEIKELFKGEVITDSDGIGIITYNEAPVYDLQIELPEGCTVKHYADTTIFQGIPDTIYELIVTGKVRSVSKATASSIIKTADIQEQALTETLDSCNTLIGSAVQAQSLAKWYLSQLQKRTDISFTWWAVATAEASDFLDVETKYGQMIQAQISSIEYDLSGGLTAKVKAVV